MEVNNPPICVVLQEKEKKKYLKRDSRLRPHDGNVNKIKK